MERKLSEVNYVINPLLANGYPPAVISNILKKKPSPKYIHRILLGMLFTLIENEFPAIACPPYIRGIKERLTRLL